MRRALLASRAMTRHTLRSLFLLALYFTAAGPLAAHADSHEGADDAPVGSIEFVGRNSVAAANGHFGEWRLAEVSIDRASLGTSFAVVEIDVASVDTGVGMRDDHLRTGDFFEVEKFPTATVRVHDVRRNGESEDGHPSYDALFDIRIRDVERSLQGSFELVDDSRVEGSLTLDRTEFGVGKPRKRWNPFSIHDEVEVRFSAPLPPGS